MGRGYNCRLETLRNLGECFLLYEAISCSAEPQFKDVDSSVKRSKSQSVPERDGVDSRAAASATEIL